MNNNAIYTKTLYDGNLSVRAKLLMFFFVQYSDEFKTDDIDISIKFLCKALKYSNHTVIKCLSELEDKGYLMKQRRGLGKNNLYTIIRGRK